MFEKFMAIMAAILTTLQSIDKKLEAIEFPTEVPAVDAPLAAEAPGKVIPFVKPAEKEEEDDLTGDAPKAKPAKKLTQADIVEVVRAGVERVGRTDVKAVLVKYGAARATLVTEKDYDAFFKEVAALQPKA